MKKFLIGLLALASVSSYASDLELSCKHYAGTEVAQNLDIKYSKNNIVVSAKSPGNFIPSRKYNAKFSDQGGSPLDREIYFEPCEGCDYDRIRVNYYSDDLLGTLAILRYVSDGPVYAQMLKCEEK